MEDTNPELVVSPMGPVTGKSKLDTLSKDDLIKFAKKQMVAMQKIKSKYADLEKEIEVLKISSHGPSDATVNQELTDKMDTILLEKAETQQSLTLLRKDHEELQRIAQETTERLEALHGELHIKNKVCEELQKHTSELTASFDATCNEYESKISQFQKKLEDTKHQLTAEIEALRDSHQLTLTESQQEIGNLQQEINRLNKQYEDDVRDLEEQLEVNAADFEKERERLLLLQDELSEQLALKEGFLHDVQEEEEETSRMETPKYSAISKTLDFPASDDFSHKAGLLEMALEDLQSQNVMLQEELTFLRNVKLELESELKQAKDEFTMEKEELEFRIIELQMNKEDGDTSVDKTKRCSLSEEQHQKVQTLQKSHNKELKELKTSYTSSAETEHQVNNLQNRGRTSAEKSTSIKDCKLSENIRTNKDVDLKTEDFMKQYKLKKEQMAVSIQALQQKLKIVFQERNRLLEQLRNAEETSAPTVEGQNMSFEDLKKESEEILLQLQHNETLVLQFKEMLIFTDQRHKECDVYHEEEALHLQVNHLENQLLIITSEKNEQIKTLEEDVCALQAKEEQCQESVRRLKCQISQLSEERDMLQRNVAVSQQQLSEACSRIMEILKLNLSETEVYGSSDISVLINHLLNKAQEEKAILIQQYDERAEQFAVELESIRREGEEKSSEMQAHLIDISREKDLLKASLDDMVLDTEGLQKDLSDLQAMNENLRAENQDLMSQVSNLSRSLEVHTPEDSEIRVTELQQSLAEKDDFISHLREEIGHLQMCKESSVSDENDNMKVLSHKIETLEKEIKDRDERMSKIKAVAVKAKKELDSSRKEVAALNEEVTVLKEERDRLSRSVKDIIHSAEYYKNLMVEYDKQTELLDQQKDKLEQAKKHSEDLSKRFQSSVQQVEQLSSEREDLMVRMEMLQMNVTQLESHVLEMQGVKSGLERELETERLLREQKTKEHQSSMREGEELQTQLTKHKHQLQQTAQELEQLRRDAQQSSLLGMEMADYEKLVKELNHKLCEKDRQMEEHETEKQALREREVCQSEEIESLKVLLNQTEEKTSRMKQLLVKAKKDLSDAKQKEAAQMVSQSSLRGELEAHQQQLEEYKIQCSELTAECHRVQEQLKVMNEQQQRTSSTYQQRLNALQDDCAAAKADLAATVLEFESYKVRVHNVLKQQKHKSSSQSDGDALKQEREHMDSVMEQLRSQLQEAQQNLQSSSAELQQLHKEHDTLLERHNKILQETVTKEAEFRERLLGLQSENVALRSEHGQCASHLSSQTEALRSSFREQVRHQQEEHCSTVDTLQTQIKRLEAQLFSMQKEPSSSTGSTLVQQNRKSQADRKLTDVPQFDLLCREEGEGMETTETESVSTPATPLPSLEHLLNAPDPKHEPVVWQMEPSKEELTHKLNTATRSMEHLNSLLHETEATNAVLMEQITLLKNELRRLERNQEREKSVANLEYLKNVLLQFIFLRSGSERQALLPVIHTMLQLSPEEKSKLAAIAQGEEESGSSRGSGWTSYLHSWSGIR